MLNRHTIFLATLERCKIAYEKNPLLFPFKAIIQQLEYLIDLNDGKTNDLSLLKNIKIGWIAVRELDGYEDQQLIDMLCAISREAETMLVELSNKNDEQ